MDFSQDLILKIKEKNFKKENVLCINSVCKRDDELKCFLFTKDIKDNKCEMCKQEPHWNKKVLDMVIFRKKKKDNNLLNNLLILCPNCYSQKQPSIYQKNKTEQKKCIDCNKSFKSISKKISLNPTNDIINPGIKKVNYQQTRCNFCLNKSMVDKSKANLFPETKVI
mgnify:FL=1|jgi:hypothetical protein